MRKMIILAIVLSLLLVGCGQQTADSGSTEQGWSEQRTETNQTVLISGYSQFADYEPVLQQGDNLPAGSDSNVLVVYFSRSGNTVIPEGVDAITSASLRIEPDGKSLGNCELVARWIVDETDAEVIEGITLRQSEVEDGEATIREAVCRLLSLYGEPEATAEDSIDRKPDEKTSFSETEQSEIPENTVKGEEQSKTVENEGVITVEKALVLSIDGQEIPVSWEDNDSVKEIMEQSLKDTILVDMHQYGGWEQVGSLGRAYSRNDTQITAQNGDIVLYSGNQIVLFYGSNSWAYTKLGHIMLSEEDITALLNKNSVSLTIEMK